MTKIDEVSKSIGNLEGTIAQGFKDINKKIDEKFASLPCSVQNTRLDNIEAFQNKQKGIIVTLGVFAGFIGWLLTPVISWVLSKIKF